MNASLFRAGLLACAASVPMQATAQGGEVISPPMAEPLCVASTGAEYYTVNDYGDGLYLYAVTDRSFGQPNIHVFASCPTREEIAFISADVGTYTSALRAPIEAMIASDETFTFEDVATRLGQGPYTAQDYYNHGDGCLCALGN